MDPSNIFELIKLSLWGEGSPTVSADDYEEMKSQAIAALPASVLSSLSLPHDLMDEWRRTILQRVSANLQYRYVQEHLPIDVPYVILKGTSAAQYYPHPEYRAMGDIDIMPRREDYERACEIMLEDGWRETTDRSDRERGRHRTFARQNNIVEIHAFFASMTDLQKARTFDDYIVNNITDSHILPDLINGLVLVEHVSQHMEQGIGLRQIIDWMMFVDRCIRDENWPQFETMAIQTGLWKLAVTLTRMCEIYLGLPIHKWCNGVDEQLCRDLMQYVMKCGNFGSKMNHLEALSISRMYRLQHPIATVKELQRRGCESWKAAKYPLLRPFAWIWEGMQLIRKTPRVLYGYQNSRRMNTLFKALGIRRANDGLVFYQEGHYFKR